MADVLITKLFFLPWKSLLCKTFILFLESEICLSWVSLKRSFFQVSSKSYWSLFRVILKSYQSPFRGLQSLIWVLLKSYRKIILVFSESYRRLIRVLLESYRSLIWDLSESLGVLLGSFLVLFDSGWSLYLQSLIRITSSKSLCSLIWVLLKSLFHKSSMKCYIRRG